MRRSHKITLAISLLGLVSLPNGALAERDSLREILNSRKMGQVDRLNDHTNKREERKLQNGIATSWLDPNTNYGQLFRRRAGLNQLIPWLTTSRSDFRVVNHEVFKTREWVMATAQLRDTTKDRINLRVLLPHPKFISMVNFGLVQRFEDLTPVPSKIIEKDNLTIGPSDAVFYQLKNGSCSLVIDGERGAKIQLFSKRCIDPSDLINKAKTFDLLRFNRKLKS